MGELVFPIMKTIQLHAVVTIIFKGFTAKNSLEMVSGTVENCYLTSLIFQNSSFF